MQILFNLDLMLRSSFYKLLAPFFSFKRRPSCFLLYGYFKPFHINCRLVDGPEGRGGDEKKSLCVSKYVETGHRTYRNPNYVMILIT